MEQITAYFLSLLEIIEKELKLFRLLAAKTFVGLCLFAMGVFLIGAGFILLAWSCFTAISMLIGPALAGLSTSALILLGGGAMLWIARNNLK